MPQQHDPSKTCHFCGDRKIMIVDCDDGEQRDLPCVCQSRVARQIRDPQPQHTPTPAATPWMNDDLIPSNYEFNPNEWVGIGPFDEDGITGYAALAHPDSAALIVWAVNSHEGLLEALRHYAKFNAPHSDIALAAIAAADPTPEHRSKGE